MIDLIAAGWYDLIMLGLVTGAIISLVLMYRQKWRP